MKKILYSAVLLLGLSVMNSCEKSEPTANWLQGMWCRTYEENPKTGELIDTSDEIREYFDFSSNFISYYRLRGSEDAAFRDGILTTPQNCHWEKELEAKYTIEDGKILISDVTVGSITKLSKDQMKYKSGGGYLDVVDDGVMERIKQMK